MFPVIIKKNVFEINATSERFNFITHHGFKSGKNGTLG